MRNLKKFLALVLAMMMTLSLMVTVNAVAPATPTDFADKDSVTQTYGEAVSVLSALGVIKGQGADEAGSFKPKDPITRAETAMLLYRIAHNDAAGTQVDIYKDYDQFPDVTSDKWYAGAVNYCANAELIKGWGGAFHPSDNVTGYEVLAMVLRMIGYGKNNEFQGAGWQIQTARYGRLAGLTANITEGTLGQPATREMVAEIMFRALLADLVDYNLLQNYYPANVLLEDNTTNRTNYANAIAAGGLTLPLNANLMYVNYDIVGKSPNLTADAFGRPAEAWVKDIADDSATKNGDSDKYIPNNANAKDANGTGVAYGPDEDYTNRDETPILVPMTPVKVYDNSVTECNLSKDINSDRSIAWSNIREVLNGDWDNKQSAAGFGPADGTLDLTGVDRTGNMDALHTTVDYIGATGRTTEIYKFTVGSTTKWVFVYIDTFLGEVVSTTPAIKDSAGHVIKKATADIDVANDDGYKTLTLETEAYEEGELVLIQTPAGAEGTPAVLDAVDSPERAPLIPSDVPNDADKFTSDAVIVSTRPTTVRVTVNATVGEQDNKMGVIGTDGKTYMASNTFLAARTGDNDTVLADWYDIPVPAKGITNNMIGRTFDLVLDHHGYIVGMDEVLTVNSSVGVITGVDNVRIGTGKYLSEVEAYMADGTTKTFQIPMLVQADGTTADTLANSVAANSTTKYIFFPSATDADDAWDSADPMYGDSIGIGSLVKFANVTIDGQSYWKIDDYDGKADAAGGDGTGVAPAVTKPTLTTKVGTLKASAVAGTTSVLPGDTDALFANRTIPMLDDKSVMFVTEYDYRYNTGNDNEGSNVDMTYKVYNGFKTMPTIEVGTAGQIVYQRLDKNPEYFLIGKVDACNDYIIKNQPTITVDESYLLLSRGATYAEYSEYNVLKNGELTTLKVANGNDKVNAMIEQTLTGSIATPVGAGSKADYENQLIVVTGTNSKGYVTSVTNTWDMAQASASAAHKALVAANSNNIASGVRIVPDAAPLAEDGSDTGIRAYGNSVLQLATDAANNYLTIADGCKVKLVNRDLGTTYDISLNEAIRYANGVDSDTTDDAVLPSHGVVFELDQYGYVCALYVIDDWNEAAP